MNKKLLALICLLFSGVSWAQVEIHNLPANTGVAGTDYMIDDNGTLVTKLSVNQLLTFMNSNGTPNLANATGVIPSLANFPSIATGTILGNCTGSNAAPQAITSVCVKSVTSQSINVNGVAVAGVPVTQRAPLSTDVTGYTVGQSIWLDGKDVYQLTSSIGGTAGWTKVTNPGLYPASAVSGAAGSWGTACYVSNWTQPILVLTRPSDSTTKAISCVNGGFDLATANSFCAPSGGICYVTALHDQTDNGAYDNTVTTTYDVTQSTLSNAPRIGLEYATINPVTGGYSVPLVFDGILRQYWETVAAYPVTNTSGSSSFCFATITILPGLPTTMTNGNSGLWMMYPTNTVTGTGVPASTTIATFNPVTGCGTFSANTTANVTSITIGRGANAVFLNLPSSLSVPMQSTSAMLSTRYGTAASLLTFEVTLGINSSSALNSYPYISFALGPLSTNYLGRIVTDPSGSTNTNGLGSVYPMNTDQVIGYSNGGTSGRTINWQINNQQGTFTGSTLTASTLTGGIWGSINPAYLAYTSAVSSSVDIFNYGLTVYGSQLTPAQMTTYTVSENLMRGWKPQITNSLICDGSSTTDGNGTTSPGMTCNAVTQRLAATHPLNDWIQGNGGSTAVSLFTYPYYISNLVNVENSQNSLEVWYPGMGNSFQQTGTLTITGNTSGNTLITTSTTLYSNINIPTSAVPGVYLSGTPSNCLATGTTITQFNSTTTFTISPAATGNCTSMTVLNETGGNAWTELVAYDALAGASGLKYVLVGSASRGTFTTSTAPYGSGTELGEFGTLKSILMSKCAPNTSGYSSGCAGLSNAVGYVDLEAIPFWGGDSGVTTVASITDSTHVVVNTTGTAAANYLVAGNRIEWVGMPYALDPTDTGNQTITAVSGSSSPYTLTISGSTSGMSVGETIRAINPTPWTNYPCTNSGVGSYSTGVWNLDRQHYCFNLGYDTQASYISQALLNTGLLK